MKLLRDIAVCACWLAVLVQPERCMGFPNNQLSIEKGFNPNNNGQVVDGFHPDFRGKMHIAGLNGLCVSVKDGDYHNGNRVVLSECKDEQEEDQLWVLKRDQTIRSGGKCLTTSGYTPGDNVVIFDCNTAEPNATRWEFLSNFGRITNRQSELSLTARKDDNDGMYYLVLDFHRFVPRQVWLPTSNTKPPVTMIASYNSLCVTLDGVQRVTMGVCDQNNKDARWAIYPDGTIRPEQHQDRCLRFEYGQHRIGVGACGGWTNEPWIYNQFNRFIFHVATGMMMDFKMITVRPIRFAPFLNCYDYGSDSQKWTMAPLHVSA